jgi:hypothetical protein
MTDRYFHEIATQSTFIQAYFAKNLNKAKWQKYHDFNSWQMPTEVWEAEKPLSEINKQFKIKQAGVISINSNTIYDWHKDEKRGAAINMILQTNHSHTLFKPNTFYLFNTQALHCVINFNEPRYLFSCEFEENKKNLSYLKILTWIKKNKL